MTTETLPRLHKASRAYNDVSYLPQNFSTASTSGILPYSCYELTEHPCGPITLLRWGCSRTSSISCSVFPVNILLFGLVV